MRTQCYYCYALNAYHLNNEQFLQVQSTDDVNILGLFEVRPMDTLVAENHDDLHINRKYHGLHIDLACQLRRGVLLLIHPIFRFRYRHDTAFYKGELYMIGGAHIDGGIPFWPVSCTFTFNLIHFNVV